MRIKKAGDLGHGHKPQVKSMLIFAVIFGAIGAYFILHSSAYFPGEINPQTVWAACNSNADNSNPSTFTPLSNSAAAALVTRQAEIRPYNATPYSIGGTSYPAPNLYVPSTAEINAFRGATDQFGLTAVQQNPYNQFVDGKDGMSNPSTDDLIQWAAHKWGIPEDWLRAQYVQESQWSQYWQGDRTTETQAIYPLYPVQSHVPNSTTDIYQSLGITQVQWQPANHPDGAVGTGTEPLRWKSTAFNIDYQAATVRFYYDNPQQIRTSWGDGSYVPCQQWNSIGGWFEPYPWNNSGQQNYIGLVQNHLNSHTWDTQSFINESLSFPPAITFNSGGAVSGDCNSDGHVNITDLSLLLSHFNQVFASCDFNTDGTVSILDLSILLSHYGT
jgi:hypothetical protein